MNISLLRISSVSQKDNTSLENQEKMINDYCSIYSIELDEIIEAVDAVCPAIELVGSRFEGGLSNIGALRLISDMVGNIAFIAGDPTTEWTQLNTILVQG